MQTKVTVNKKCICGKDLETGYNTFCKKCCSLPRDQHGVPIQFKKFEPNEKIKIKTFRLPKNEC